MPAELTIGNCIKIAKTKNGEFLISKRKRNNIQIPENLTDSVVDNFLRE